MKDPLIQQLEEADKAQEARRKALEKFPIQKIGGIALSAPKWLVYRFIEEGAVGLLVGESGAGKSFFGIAIGLALAAGRTWNGKPTHKATVLYIAGEGRDGVIRRVYASVAANKEDIQSIQFFIAPGVNLSDPDAMQEVTLALEEIAEKTPPKLIIADTWATSLQADENSVSDTMQGLAAIKSLAEPYHAAILIVHHVGHGEKNRARGSSALHAAMDTVHLVERHDDGILQVINIKSKDSEPSAPLAFRLETVSLGIFDDQGDEVKSAYLVETEYTPEQGPKDASGKWQKLALDTLKNLIEKYRSNLERKGLDPETARVLSTDWRHGCLDAGIPRQRFYEIQKTFLQAGIIHEETGYVRL